MNTQTSFLLIALCGMMFLAGCGTSMPQGDPIAQQGVVSRIYSSRELRYEARSCLFALTAEQRSAGKYIDVRVHYEKGYRITSAFVPPSLQAQIGDVVRLTSVECTRESIPQVTQILQRRFKSLEQ